MLVHLHGRFVSPITSTISSYKIFIIPFKHDLPLVQFSVDTKLGVKVKNMGGNDIKYNNASTLSGEEKYRCLSITKTISNV